MLLSLTNNKPAIILYWHTTKANNHMTLTFFQLESSRPLPSTGLEFQRLNVKVIQIFWSVHPLFKFRGFHALSWRIVLSDNNRAFLRYDKFKALNSCEIWLTVILVGGIWRISRIYTSIYKGIDCYRHILESAYPTHQIL